MKQLLHDCLPTRVWGWDGSPGLTLAVYFYFACSGLFPHLTHSTILTLAAGTSSSSVFAQLPMLGCWVSRNNGQLWGLTPVQRPHMGMQLLNIHLFIVFHLFFLFPIVKYMREATPYVKKGSPVSEIGWETPPPESPRLGCASADPMSQLSLSIHRDRKTIPLKMCYVTRNMTVSDPENRWMGICLGLGFHFHIARLLTFSALGLVSRSGALATRSNPAREMSTTLGGVSGGVWATWGWAQLLGCARETLMQ